MLTSLRTAYTSIRAERDRIADVYAALDADLYYPMDATLPVGRFHPESLPPASSLPELSQLVDPQQTSPPPASRTLGKVAHHAQWLLCMHSASARDSSSPSPLSAVRNREATRLISVSMPSSGAWLDNVPDGTRVTKDNTLRFEVAIQQRLGLYLAHAAPTVTALRSAGRLEIDYYGDSMANGGEYNRRHNAVNLCVAPAIGAVAIEAVILGDKEHAGNTAHLNSTHVLDIAELGGDEDTGGDCIYETKCANPLLKSFVLGRGSATHGGAPASMGHRIAFGNTAEHYALPLPSVWLHRTWHPKPGSSPARYRCGLGGPP
jgi:hypothetical protein